MTQSTNKTKVHSLSASVSFSTSTFSAKDKEGAPGITGTSYFKQFTDTVTGRQNPQYRDQIKKGINAGTPSSGARYVAKAADVSGSRNFYSANPATYDPNQLGTIHRKGSFSGQATVTGSLILPALPLTGAAVTSADNQAIQKLYSQIKGIQSSVNTGEDLAEFGKTLKMLRNPLQSLIRLSHDVVNGHLAAFNYNKAKHIAKALADTTLEYNFGIRPIISSVAKGMVGLQNRDYIARYFPINAKGQFDTSTVDEGSQFSGIFASRWTLRSNIKTTVRYKGMWALGADFDRRSVQDVLGWNYRDIIPTVYNLIPYTWLLDYVTNTGNIVDSLSVPWSGMRWCMKTVRKEASNEGFFVKFSSPPAYPVGPDSFTPGRHTVSGTAFVRSLVTSLPVPTPQVNWDLTTGQWTNVAALFASRLPIIGSRLSSALKTHPSLPREYSVLTQRRSEYKIPYPFHRK
jgi:hypothetical protein